MSTPVAGEGCGKADWHLQNHTELVEWIHKRRKHDHQKDDDVRHTGRHFKNYLCRCTSLYHWHVYSVSSSQHFKKASAKIMQVAFNWICTYVMSVSALGLGSKSKVSHKWALFCVCLNVAPHTPSGQLCTQLKQSPKIHYSTEERKRCISI